MTFDSVTFWVFFPAVWAAWWWLPFRAAKTAALLASLVFYGWWNPWYLPLIFLSAGVDYTVGARLHRAQEPATRRRLLWLSLAVNLGLLAVFKYGPFAVENASQVARALGLDANWRLAGWVIPIGISFYTFQTLSYTIDIYRRQLEPARSFRDFFLYVAFFPQLVAGPIVRARSLLPQFAKRPTLRLPEVQLGLYQIVVGLFLKVVIADNLAPAVDRVFQVQVLAELTPLETWLGVLYFSVQIFADFAAYSGIAIGVAHLMGIRFPDNFRYPYISRGLSEFWTRWHISLSSWLRDYLYIPLGGKRRGRARTYAALMGTMLLGGLWHGAAWTFVAWGGLHGLGLWVERAWLGASRARGPAGPLAGAGDFLGRVWKIAIVFVFVLTTWVFFRAPSFEMALLCLRRMYVTPFTDGFGLEKLAQAHHLVFVAPVLLMHLGQAAHEWGGLRKGAYLRASVAAVLLLLLVVVERGAGVEFIYFQF